VSRLRAYGLGTEPPGGWEAEIYQRPGVSATERRFGGAAVAVPEVEGAQEAAPSTPIVHLANFALPSTRGDYGGGAVELMGRGGIFISLLEHDPAEVGTALFAAQGVPWPLSADDFGPQQMQRPLPGQAGCQRFFTVSGRAFCLYVAIGSHLTRALLVREVNAALATVSFD
jgi:hypothetical protein